MIRRVRRGVSPFTPGRDHIHHLLIDSGISIKIAVIFIYIGAIICGLIGIFSHVYNFNESIMFISFAALFGAYFIITSAFAPKEI